MTQASKLHRTPLQQPHITVRSITFKFHALTFELCLAPKQMSNESGEVGGAYSNMTPPGADVCPKQVRHLQLNTLKQPAPDSSLLMHIPREGVPGSRTGSLATHTGHVD